MCQTRTLLGLAALALPLLSLAAPRSEEPARPVDAPAPGEYGTQRPGGAGDDPADVPRDLPGRSAKTARVRVIHTTDPALAGGSAYFMFREPWGGYQRGRGLCML